MKLLAIALAGFVALHGASPAAAAAERLKVEGEMVIVPQKDAWALLPELEDAAKIEAASKRLQEMIRSGGATSVARYVVRTARGQRIAIENIQEIRYPSNFEPPQFLRRNLTQDVKVPSYLDYKPSEPETRNVGPTLEAEIEQEGEGRPLRVMVSASHVRFLRWEKFEGGRLPNGQKLTYEQPVFHTMRSQLSYPARSGELVLVGVHRVPDAEPPALELMLLRVTREEVEEK